MEEQNQKDSFKNSITAKMLLTGALIIGLMIPLRFVNDLVKERKHRSEDVVKDINSRWGEEVLIYGPILELEYSHFEEIERYDIEKKERVKVVNEIIRKAYAFPDDLTINANADSRARSIGNYESVVFSSAIDIKGAFKNLDFSDKGIEAKNIHWEKSRIIIKTTNLRGIKSEMAIGINQEKFPFEANATNVAKFKGKQLVEMNTAMLGCTAEEVSKGLNFEMQVAYNGSEQINFIPIGKTTKVAMKSNWHSPSFVGEFLPKDDRKITDEGFTAEWLVLDINRPFSQKYLASFPSLYEFAFGTRLIVPVDEYQQTQRTTKYGILIIGLTFLAFFLIQTLSKIHIHVFQYLMIGVALVMFYTLLLSISEHSNFNLAYGVSSLAVFTMITLYATSIFKNFRFPLLVGGSLAGLYGFVYVIIQLENYALLFGSIGLFVILGIVMFVSRKVRWEEL
ncbi:cell envelope integrity protein CreD [Wenyingzhuangia sp. IMCC45574]